MSNLPCRCPACGREINENDLFVVCPECGAPHHKDCWFSLGGCSAKDFEHVLAPVAKAPAVPFAVPESPTAPTAEPARSDVKDEGEGKGKRKKHGAAIAISVCASVVALAVAGALIIPRLNG